MGKGVLRTWPQPPDAWTEIQMIGSDGVQRWSTADSIFHVTDVLQGSQSFPQRMTPVTGNSTATLGSCNAAATYVLGYMKLASVGLQAGQLSPFPAVGDWYYVSGTYLGFTGIGDDCCAYTFMASGGVVSLEEQLAVYEVKNSVGQTFNFPAFTLDYELWIGYFR